MKVFLQRILQEIMKKIVLGTSDAWSTIHLSHRPSDRAWIYLRLTNFWSRAKTKCMHTMLLWQNGPSTSLRVVMGEKNLLSQNIYVLAILAQFHTFEYLRIIILDHKIRSYFRISNLFLARCPFAPNRALEIEINATFLASDRIHQ